MNNSSAIELADLRRDVAQLSAEVAELRAALRGLLTSAGHAGSATDSPERERQPTTANPSDAGPPPTHPAPSHTATAEPVAAVAAGSTWTRRSLIAGGLGAAAAGAAASLGASPAAAAAGGNFILGAVNSSGASASTLTSSAATTLTVTASTLGASAGLFINAPSGVQRSLGAAGLRDSALFGAHLAGGVGALLTSNVGPALVMNPGDLTAPPILGAPVVGGLYAVNRKTLIGGAYELWMCVGGEPPGKYVLISSPSSAGAYIPIEPARVFDSRYQPPVGPVVKGSPRIFNVRDAYNPSTNTVREANVVPIGASAVTLNLTVTGTNSSGYAALERGTSATAKWSSINWGGANQTIANGLTVMLDTQRRLKAFVEGVAGTRADIIVDVTGYYQSRSSLDG